ncbi:hypothetical protein RI367_002921 [Sorochytrium milnesiophthora]
MSDATAYWQSLTPLLRSPSVWLAASATAAVCYQALQFTTYVGPRRRPPGPNNNQIFRAREAGMRGQFHKLMAEYVDEYGDFFAFKVLGNWFYLTTDATVVREMLKDTETFVREKNFERSGSGVGGPMLFAISGPKWKSHRKIISPGFAPAHLRHAFGVMLDLSDRLLEQLDARIEQAAGDNFSKEINMHDMFSRVALDVFARAFLSCNVDVITNPDQSITRAANGIFYGMAKRFEWPKWLWPYVTSDNFDESVIVLRDLIHRTIESKLAQTSVDDGANLDLLDILIKAARENEEAMPLDELVSETLGFLVAGYDTAANTLTFALKALCDHPQEADKVRQEIRKVVGSKRLTMDLVTQLKQLDLFIKEAMRCLPVIEVGARSIAKDTVIHGYTVPKGTSIHYLTSHIHNNPKYWRDPEQFMPSRFETDVIVPGSYIPFGDGPHRCVGEKLALLEIKTILIKLLQHYDFQLAPNQPLVTKLSITLGQLSILQWLYEQGARHLGRSDINKAAARGHLSVCWGVAELGTHFHADEMAILSLSRGHLEMAQWLSSHRSEPDWRIRTLDGRFALNVLEYGDQRSG